jgi:hypothetical protein
MDDHPILAALDKMKERYDSVSLYSGPLPEIPAHLETPRRRGRRKVDAPSPLEYTALGDVRREMEAFLQQYINSPNPSGEALQIRVPPGVGKTTLLLAILVAMSKADPSFRAGYVAPRHALAKDLIAASEAPELFYEQRPREAANCQHHELANSYAAKGYAAWAICQSRCTREFARTVCPYHMQRRQQEPIFVLMAQFLQLGHPRLRTADVVVVDESSIDSFTHRLKVRAEHVMPPPEMRPDYPMYDLLTSLAYLALQSSRIAPAEDAHLGRQTELSGEALLEALGGAQRVWNAVKDIPEGLRPDDPDVTEDGELDNLPPVFITQLAAQLRRDIDWMRQNPDKVLAPRVLIRNGKLELLHTRPLHKDVPSHLVLLDGTGDTRIYESLLGRPVREYAPRVKPAARIFQVYDRLYGVRQALQAHDQVVKQVRAILSRGYDPARAGIITHKKLLRHIAEQHDNQIESNGRVPWEQRAADAFGIQREHMLWYGAHRGTNALESLQALIVIGAPMPNPAEMRHLYAQYFPAEMEAVDDTWSDQDLVYQYVEQDEGDTPYGFAVPVNGYWGSPKLQSVLWQKREAEIIQAAHRIRLNNRGPEHPDGQADLWLITSLPISELPPTELLSNHDLLNAPTGVNKWGWHHVEAYAAVRYDQQLSIQATDLAQAIDCDPDTARKYMGELLKRYPDRWAFAQAERKGRGRPAMELRPVG